MMEMALGRLRCSEDFAEKVYIPPKLNSSPLKSYLTPKKERIVFGQPSFLRDYVQLPGSRWTWSSYLSFVLLSVGFMFHVIFSDGQFLEAVLRMSQKFQTPQI